VIVENRRVKIKLKIQYRVVEVRITMMSLMTAVTVMTPMMGETMIVMA